MKLIRWFAVCVVFVFGTSACADKKNELPAEVVAALEKAEELEIYSLGGERNVKDGWHGAKVLGKTTVKGDDVKKVAAAIKKGVSEGDAVAACFNPRHGIRVTHDKKTYDIVICFECLQIAVYSGEDKLKGAITSGSPQKVLNKILTDAKVPLPEPEK